MSEGMVSAGCELESDQGLGGAFKAQVGYEDEVLELLLTEFSYLEQVGRLVREEGLSAQRKNEAPLLESDGF